MPCRCRCVAVAVPLRSRGGPVTLPSHCGRVPCQCRCGGIVNQRTENGPFAQKVRWRAGAMAVPCRCRGGQVTVPSQCGRGAVPVPLRYNHQPPHLKRSVRTDFLCLRQLPPPPKRQRTKRLWPSSASMAMGAGGWGSTMSLVKFSTPCGCDPVAVDGAEAVESQPITRTSNIKSFSRQSLDGKLIVNSI